MKSKKLGMGLDALFGEIDEAYADESIENNRKPITDEQIKRLNFIEDSSIKKFINKKANNNFGNMEICLSMYEFLKEYFAHSPKNKNYKHDYVIHKFNEISLQNKNLKVKEHIQLTADSLDVTFYAVRNHIYKKST